MKVLASISSADIYGENMVSRSISGPLRISVRIVPVDENGYIGLGYYEPNDSQRGGYTLIGGGVEHGETIEQATVRECKEEGGINIKNIRELGIIKEFGVGKKTIHNQENYCFLASVDGKKMPPTLTEEEKEENLQIRWIPLVKALSDIKKQGESFAKKRALIVLTEAQKILADH